MARPSTVYVCAACGGESAKWQGQCAQCGEWNSLERREAVATRAASTKAGRASRGPLAPAQALATDGLPSRFSSGLGERDRVLGGGCVPGSVTRRGGR